MALLPVKDIPFKEQKQVKIRIQELDPQSPNGRPYEEDLTPSGWHADSIADLPLPGDFLVLTVERLKAGSTLENQVYENRNEVFKVLTRLFDYQVFEDSGSILCNIVVEPVKNSELVGKLVKD